MRLVLAIAIIDAGRDRDGAFDRFNNVGDRDGGSGTAKLQSAAHTAHRAKQACARQL